MILHEATIGTKINFEKGTKCYRCKKQFEENSTLSFHVTKAGTFRLLHSGCKA